MSENEQDQARVHAQSDLDFAETLIADDDPDRYADIAAVLRRAASRFDFLHEVTHG